MLDNENTCSKINSERDGDFGEKDVFAKDEKRMFCFGNICLLVFGNDFISKCGFGFRNC